MVNQLLTLLTGPLFFQSLWMLAYDFQILKTRSTNIGLVWKHHCGLQKNGEMNCYIRYKCSWQMVSYHFWLTMIVFKTIGCTCSVSMLAILPLAKLHVLSHWVFMVSHLHSFIMAEVQTDSNERILENLFFCTSQVYPLLLNEVMKDRRLGCPTWHSISKPIFLHAWLMQGWAVFLSQQFPPVSMSLGYVSTKCLWLCNTWVFCLQKGLYFNINLGLSTDAAARSSMEPQMSPCKLWPRSLCSLWMTFPIMVCLSRVFLMVRSLAWTDCVGWFFFKV